jgi:hypothetical protein
MRFLAASLLLLLGARPGFAAEPAKDAEDALVSLSSGVIDPRQPPAIPRALRAAEDDEHVLVKFPAPVTASQLEALRHAVRRIYTYLPHHAFLVNIPAERRGALRSLGASWASPFHPRYKLSRAVAAVDPARDPTRDRRRLVMLHVYPDGDLDGVVRQLRGLGLTVAGAKSKPLFSHVRLLLTSAEIARHRETLARIPEVFWVDLEARQRLLNDTTIWVGQSGLSAGHATPVFDHGLFGEGQVVGILDTGIDADMCYFRDGAAGLPPRNECDGGTVTDAAQRKVLAVDFLWNTECSGGIGANEWDTHGHGSHVAGTVAGDDLASPLLHDHGDGMAPGAKLVIQDAGFQTDPCADLPGIGCPVVDLKPLFAQAYAQGARMHTNSWGDQEDASVQNNYTAACQDVDEFMWTHKDFQIFFAAGNSGPGARSVGSPSTAKSAVSVGATLRAASANTMASFSSCGPTDDGRIKPEVTVPGSSIVSASADRSVASNNCGTVALSGTSMASPGAAGFTALIRQYYTAGWYPSGAAVAADGFTPSAALLRATLVNSAQAMTGAPAIPGNCQGWGRVLLENALYFSGQTRTLWVEDDAAGFASGAANDTRSFTFTVEAGEPFKATLAWTDFPSTPAASPHLNNDLDLTVTGPAGTFHGNVFSGGESATGGTADRRNTLEQVLLASPAPGIYTVTVSAFNVPNGPQPFALVATGALTPGVGNLPPTANAGPDQNVAAQTTVVLDGSASHDPDGGPSPLSFSWTQTSGPSVSIAGADQAVASIVPSLGGSYVFQLQVSDGAAQAEDQLTVNVAPPPVVLFADDFETASGWRADPRGRDTAVSGRWERGVPEATDSSGPKQLGTTTSGSSDLVTGRLAGASPSANAVSGGSTSIQSPAIALPSTGTLTLTFQYYLAHGAHAGPMDFLRVSVLSGGATATLFETRGSRVDVDAAWTQASLSLNAFAGRTVRLLIEASGGNPAGLVEAAIDDLRVTQR